MVTITQEATTYDQRKIALWDDADLTKKKYERCLKALESGEPYDWNAEEAPPAPRRRIFRALKDSA